MGWTEASSVRSARNPYPDLCLGVMLRLWPEDKGHGEVLHSYTKDVGKMVSCLSFFKACGSFQGIVENFYR
jgi:hypothetical protein